MKMCLLLTAFIATLFAAGIAGSTSTTLAEANRATRCPHGGYCPPGTCAKFRSTKWACNTANCSAANCKR